VTVIPHARADGVPPGTPDHDSGTSRPLVVTGSPELRERLAGIMAAVGVEPELSGGDGPPGRQQWSAASVILVGDDTADDLISRGLPRRPGVVLLSGVADAEAWRRGVELGAETVTLLPDGERWLVGRIADAVDGAATEGVTVAVLGARGGAGASMLATALATRAARMGARALLVDADPIGGGLDLLAGCDEQDGLRWPDLASSQGRISCRALYEALPHAEGLAVLSWDRGSVLAVPRDAVRTVLLAGRRGCDLVVADLPRHLDVTAEETLAWADHVLLVVPAEVRAVAAATRLVRAIEPYVSDVRLVVRTPAPGGLQPDEIAQVLDLRLAGVLKSEAAVAADVESGIPPGSRDRGPLADLCSTLLTELVGLPGGRHT
jgi:secretion/DNA translocation related CpaE-like protein